MEGKKIGVIGSGSFGTTIAIILSYSNDVLIYTRNPKTLSSINNDHIHQQIELSPRIVATTDKKEICDSCTIIFPIVPSAAFRDMIQSFSPYLKPSHILIHGTKGFDIRGIKETELFNLELSRKNIATMSEVILEETVVRRVGCIAGPNLSKEIKDGYPTAAVLASKYNEVFELGKKALSTNRFFVFASYDITGAEIAGALKNIIALGSGIIAGKQQGKNLQAMLITRGLREMIYFGKAMGAESRAFLGTAGIGDLIATATSENSRNYSVGMRLGKGESLDDILSSMDEVVEGLRTLRIAQHLATHYGIHVPITQLLYKVVFEGYDFNRAIEFLMRYPYAADVDFL